MYTNRCVNERTSLTRPLDSPDYVEFASLLRSRKTRIRQFQCCICATLIAIFTMALVVTVSYSVSHDMMDAGPNLTAPSFDYNANLTRSLKKLKLGFAPGSGSYTLFSNPSITPSNSIFVPDQTAKETRRLTKEEVKEGLKAGRQAVSERLFTDALTSPLPSPSPEVRHRHAVSTCIDAGTLALAAVAELAATRKIENLRAVQGEPSAIGSFFDAGWKIFGACKQLTTPDCPPTKYRTFDGSCNRPMQMGAAMTPFIRHLPPDYGDGINAPRKAVSGADLPSAREVSLIVHKPSPSSNPSFTVMLAVYGQFLDHDITATALSQGLNGTSIPCCPPSDGHPECFPVPVSSGDPVFDVAGRTCMDFVRSAPAPQCKLGPRQQLNQVSAFIDGSTIYGADKSAAESLREFTGGRLRMQLTPDNRTLLPASTDPNDGCNREAERRRGRYCFAAGDARANENLHLTTMHLLWARQHNRVADRLARINPSWDDETLYEESRRVVGAQLQHITYREFVPIILGDRETDKRELRPVESGYRKWKLERNDTSFDPSVANSFAAAAFRFAHTLLPGLMRMTDERAGTSSYVELHRMLFNPYSLYAEGGLRSSINSATRNVIQMTSAHVTSQLTNHLFEDPVANVTVPCGLDLVSLNIQRGRDHGIPGYTAWREYCGLGKVESFSDLEGHLDPQSLEDIASLYESVHDIDLYTGALAELPNSGSIVGSTFMCLIADQFVRLQRGDRFWYELAGQPHSFTEDQLTELRKMSLARLICDCSDEIGQIQAEVMRAVGPENPMISCEDIPAPSYEPWRETIERATSFNWTGLRDDINNTIEEIVAYINNSRTGLDTDWQAFKNYISDTFSDLRNQLSELRPSNDSQAAKERSDSISDSEPYRYWIGLKSNVTGSLNRSMQTMTGGPAAVTKWMAFKRSIVDQFASLKDQIAAMRADVAPKLEMRKKKSEQEQISNVNSSRMNDTIPAIFDWKNFKSNVISSLNNTIANIKGDKMPPPGDPAWATYKDQFSAFRNEIDSQRSAALATEKSNASSDWSTYKDRIVETVNEIVDKIKNGMPPPGDPAWATYRNEITKSFSNFIPSSLEHANTSENVPFRSTASAPVTSNNTSNLTLDWSEFRARINDSVIRMIEGILSKRPTEIDPIAWAVFRATAEDEFAKLRSEIGSIRDEWLGTEIGRKGKDSSNLGANWSKYNYSEFDSLVVPSKEEWDDFKKEINDTVMNILSVANSSNEFGFDELHTMFNRSFTDLRNQISSLRTLIEETYDNKTAADWLSFQAQMNSTVKGLVDGSRKGDELSTEDAIGVLFKAKEELSNVQLPANSAAIPPAEWIQYASHVNKTIWDALRNINDSRNHYGTMMLRAEETITSSSSSNDPKKFETNWLIVSCLLGSFHVFTMISKFQIRV